MTDASARTRHALSDTLPSHHAPATGENAPLTTFRKSLSLDVVPLADADTGQGIIRLSTEDMAHLDVISGDIVAIVGEIRDNRITFTHARVRPLDQPRSRSGIVALDPIQCRNAGAQEGASVQVRKVRAQPCHAVTLESDGLPDDLSAPGIAAQLAGYPLTAGDSMQIISPRHGPRMIRIVATEPSGPVIAEDTMTVTFSGDRGAAPQTPFQVLEERIDEVIAPSRTRLSVAEAVEEILATVEGPLLDRGLMDRLPVRPARGVLIGGAPGSGRTSVARRLSSALRVHYQIVNGHDLLTHMETVAVSELTTLLDRMIHRAPSILFIDDFDAIFPGAHIASAGGHACPRLLATLTSRLTSIEEGVPVTVIGAVSNAALLPDGLVRDRCFERVLRLDLPGETERETLVLSLLEDFGIPPHDVDVADIVARTIDWSPLRFLHLRQMIATAALRRARQGPHAAVGGLTVQPSDITTAVSLAVRQTGEAVLTY